MQINIRPMEIITCFLKQKVAICVVGEFISVNQTTTVPDLGLTL